MSKGRIEAFSDGVMAVAITLLALDLHVPDPAHHAMLRRPVTVDHTIPELSLVLLLRGILSPYLTLAICAAVAAFYALPGTTFDDHQQVDPPPMEDTVHRA